MDRSKTHKMQPSAKITYPGDFRSNLQDGHYQGKRCHYNVLMGTFSVYKIEILRHSAGRKFPIANSRHLSL